MAEMAIQLLGNFTWQFVSHFFRARVVPRMAARGGS
jgi:hypothetical protein